MACVQSQKSSFQDLHGAPVQRQIASIDYHFTSHVCGFCVTTLVLRSDSRYAHQATHHSFSAGTSSAMKNHAQVGPSSCVFGIDESAVRLEGRWSGKNLQWRHSTEMVDHKNSVPVGFGFGETTFIPSCFECRSRQVCVFKRNTHRQLMVSLLPEVGFLAKNHLPSQTPQWISVPVRQLKLYLRDSEWIQRGPTAVVHPLELLHQRHHEKSYQRPSKRLTHELSGSTTKLQYMKSGPCQPHGLTTVRWCNLTFCQLHFGGCLQNSYLWDMACITDGVSTLGPVVVAQQVVDPGHLLPPP